MGPSGLMWTQLKQKETLLVIDDTPGAVVTGKLVKGTWFLKIGGVTAERK